MNPQIMGEKMNYIRPVDFAAIEQSGPEKRLTQTIIDHTSGAKTCTIYCIKTPAGSGSPAGLHTHEVDQIFYILKGTMSIEIENKEYEVGAGTLSNIPSWSASPQLERGQGTDGASGVQHTDARSELALRDTRRSPKATSARSFLIGNFIIRNYRQQYNAPYVTLRRMYLKFVAGI